MARIAIQDLQIPEQEMSKHKMQSVIGGAYDAFLKKGSFSFSWGAIEPHDTFIEPNDTFINPDDYFRAF